MPDRSARPPESCWLADDITRLARDLIEARRSARPLDEADRPMTLEEGYAVQRAGRNIRTRNGERVIGHKVGLTSQASRSSFSLDEPVSGSLFDTGIAKQSDEFSLAGCLAPRVEVEIAFLMRTALSGESITPDEVMAATSEVAIALEIVDSRWKGGVSSVSLLVADNVSAAGVVLGQRTSVSVAELAGIEVSVEMGDTAVKGDARNVFEHPARSVGWLVWNLARMGDRLEAGDIVMSGSFISPIPISPADHLDANFGPLGRIATTFTD